MSDAIITRRGGGGVDVSANSYFSLSSPQIVEVSTTGNTTVKQVTINVACNITVFYQTYRSNGNYTTIAGRARLLVNDVVMFTDSLVSTSTAANPDVFTHSLSVNVGDVIKLQMNTTLYDYPDVKYSCKNFNVLINTNLNIASLISDLGSVTL